MPVDGQIKMILWLVIFVYHTNYIKNEKEIPETLEQEDPTPWRARATNNTL